MKIQILNEALLDLEEGFFFYERLGSGLGRDFMDSLILDIDSLAVYSGIHPKIHGYHRRLARRFPFAVYYSTREDLIEIWRILDCRQNPVIITRKLKRL